MVAKGNGAEAREGNSSAIATIRDVSKAKGQRASTDRWYIWSTWQRKGCMEGDIGLLYI